MLGVKMKFLPLALLAVVVLASFGVSSSSLAQEAWVPAIDSNTPLVLTRSGSDSEPQAYPSAAELRQQRALFRSQQRLERIERNAWLGHEPLRPSFNAIPMMTSRYLPPQVFYFPFVWGQ